MYANCLCGCNNYKIVNFKLADQEYKVLECGICGLGRTWPAPINSSNLEDYYQEQEDYLLRFNQLDLWRKFTSRSIKIIKEFKSSGKILDIGCNVGILVKSLMENGYDAYGVDLCEKAIRFGGEKFNISQRLKVGTLSDSNFPDNYFDVISYTHVLEHIENLNEELNGAYKKLSPGGILYIEVPNYKSLWSILLQSKWYGCSFKQHIWQFNKKTLEKILISDNYTILKLSSQFNMHHEIRPNLKGLAKLTISLFSFILKRGDNLIIVARKGKQLMNI